ncbi:PAS domain-containing sensor histidine kinase, partial [Pantanalinema rosaneae CENA516]|uniref:PAS domain-containing sensor histidine kinase n=1 Tax=Pantanalinema rosaneae TaxID=1620701 RepID=UPI003D700CAA
MLELLQILFNSDAFIPHGHCYLWKPGLVGLHLLADSLIALAYFSIPLSLLYFIHKRRDVPFNGILLLFSSFIISCGITHVLEIWTLWHPTYWLSGLSKAVTAFVSVYTAIALVSLIPHALVLPGLAVTNQVLEAEIAERRKTEAALRESEARFQAFMDNSPTASWITNEMGQLVYISQTYSQVFQIPADYVPQKTDVTLYPSDLRQQYLQNIQQVVQSRSVLKAIELAPTQAGTIGQFLVYKFPIETLSGQCLVGGVAIDITEQVRAEQALHELNQDLEARIEQRTIALQESQAQLLAITSLQQAILDGTDYSIISTDPNGTIQTFNAAAQKMLGYTADEVIGQITPERIHDSQEVEQRADLLSAELNTTIPPGFEVFVAQAQRGITSEAEWTYIRKDGSRFPVLLSVTALRDATAQIIGFLGIAKDITRQKQLEAQARKNAAHLLAAQRIAHLGSWEFDLQTQEVLWSEEVFRLFGRDLAAGNPTFAEVQQAVHPDDRHHYDQAVHAAVASQQSYEIEFRVYHSDGTLRYLQGRGEPVLNSQGQLVRLVGTILDITDRKQKEAQLRHTNEQLAQTNMELARATRMKDEFLANMSHELRTPLNAILGLSEGLQDQVFGNLNAKQIKALGTIERSGRHLLELINDILDLAKIESGKLELQLSPVSVKSLCDASLMFVKELALKKNIQITTQIPDDLHAVQADDRRLRQVLINLLSNAVKFTPDSGSIRLAVHLEPFDSPSSPASSSSPCLLYTS